MFTSFDMKFIRRDQKTRRNGEALPRYSAFSVKPITLHTKKIMWYYIYHAISPCFKTIEICVNVEFMKILFEVLGRRVTIVDMLR